MGMTQKRSDRDQAAVAILSLAGFASLTMQIHPTLARTL
jgi:hypothetical protein